MVATHSARLLKGRFMSRKDAPSPAVLQGLAAGLQFVVLPCLAPGGAAPCSLYPAAQPACLFHVSCGMTAASLVLAVCLASEDRLLSLMISSVSRACPWPPSCPGPVPGSAKEQGTAGMSLVPLYVALTLFCSFPPYCDRCSQPSPFYLFCPNTGSCLLPHSEVGSSFMLRGHGPTATLKLRVRDCPWSWPRGCHKAPPPCVGSTVPSVTAQLHFLGQSHLKHLLQILVHPGHLPEAL